MIIFYFLRCFLFGLQWKEHLYTETAFHTHSKSCPGNKIYWLQSHDLGLPWWLSVKSPAANAGDVGSVPGSGRYLVEGNGNPLQCSCLENSMDRGAWRATVHWVTKESDRTWWLNSDNNSHDLAGSSCIQWVLPAQYLPILPFTLDNCTQSLETSPSSLSASHPWILRFGVQNIWPAVSYRFYNLIKKYPMR